jgi:hypothetical protein
MFKILSILVLSLTLLTTTLLTSSSSLSLSSPVSTMTRKVISVSDPVNIFNGQTENLVQTVCSQFQSSSCYSHPCDGDIGVCTGNKKCILVLVDNILRQSCYQCPSGYGDFNYETRTWVCYEDSIGRSSTCRKTGNPKLDQLKIHDTLTSKIVCINASEFTNIQPAISTSQPPITTIQAETPIINAKPATLTRTGGID